MSFWILSFDFVSSTEISFANFSAALIIAAYAPHRHKFPSIDVRIFFFPSFSFRKKPVKLTTNPGVQKPH